jgi:hypothetical protein
MNPYQKIKNLLLALSLSTLGICIAFITLPENSTAQISAQDVGTVTCNGTVSATSIITLVGKITRSPFITPVNNVQVFVFDTNLADGRSCYSDSNGQYTVTLDAAHTYDVVYNPPLTSQLASYTETGLEGVGIITKNIPLKPGFSISGVTRRQSDNSAVGKVEIYAHNPNTGISLGLPPSNDPGGDYQISLESGDWLLTFTPQPFQELGPTRTQSITLITDTTRDIFLPAGVTVYGQVKSSTGEEVSGVSIFARMESGTQTGEGYGLPSSKAGGWYTGTLPTGSFDVRFMPPTGLGFGPAVITNQTPPTSAYYLSVTLPAGVTLSGTVVCTSPLVGVFVFADPEINIPGDDIGGVGEYTDSQGKFGLPLITGAYRLEFQPPSVTQLPTREITTTILTDTFLIINFCPVVYLPVILKS